MGYKVWTRRRRITKAVLDQVKHVEDVNILHYLKFVRGVVCVPVGAFGGACVDGFEGALFFENTRAVQPRRKSSN